MAELLPRLHPKQGGYVVTPNTDHLAKLQKDEEFYQVYQKADYRVCDSQILLFLSRLLNAPIREKITGSDLLPAFCHHFKDDEEVRVFLLGGPLSIPGKAQNALNKKAGRQIIVGSHCPSFGFEKDEAECQELVDMINQSGANVLAIGVGAPKQEKWMFKYKDQLKNIRTALAIGAALQFEAGTVTRAPRWVSDVGLEWLYRVLQEPKRLWKRYLFEAPPVLGLLVKQRFGIYQNPLSHTQKSHSQKPKIMTQVAETLRRSN